MGSQYDEFADDYEWIYSDFTQAGDRHLLQAKKWLDSFENPVVLDSACGTGVLALALAKNGFCVTGTDASAGMVAKAKEYAGKEGLNISFLVREWDELPKTFGQQFDVVFCCGNAIGHCRDEKEMVRALQGIHSVMKPNGMLVIDTRNWEKLLAEQTRFTSLGPRQRGGKKCIPLYVWTFPRVAGDPVIIEVLFPVEENDKVTLHSYQITYHPFTVGELVGRLERAGFVDVETDFSDGKVSYVAVGWKRAQASSQRS